MEKENFYGLQSDFNEDEYDNAAYIIDASEDEDFNPEGDF